MSWNPEYGDDLLPHEWDELAEEQWSGVRPTTEEEIPW